jgi:hypothetical protein
VRTLPANRRSLPSKYPDEQRIDPVTAGAIPSDHELLLLLELYFLPSPLRSPDS